MPALPFQPPPDGGIRSVVLAARRYLATHHVVNSDWQAELLVGGVVGLKRHELYLNTERTLSGVETARIRDVLLRRANGEPTQYILGQTEFYGLPFKCDQRALIPRPETELLVEQALKQSAAGGERPRILDLGTGSGCVAVAIAANRPEALVVGTDISAEALCLARANAELNGVSDRVALVQSDLFSGISGHFDLIVANPPYCALTDRNKLMPEVRDHEPAVALYGGNDGLDFVRRIVTESADYLVPDGHLLFEIGYDQAETVKRLAESAGSWREQAAYPDYQGYSRVFGARKL